MTLDDNKALVRRFYEAINQRDLDTVSALLAPDLSSNTEFDHASSGRQGFEESFASAIEAFPDYTIRIDDQIAEDDKVVTRYTALGTLQGTFMGVAGSGQSIELIGIDINRIADGVIVEHWSEANLQDLMVRLGIVRPRSA